MFAPTYFSQQEALQAQVQALCRAEHAVLDRVNQATSSDPDALFFAKLPEQSGGRGIRVLRREANGGERAAQASIG